MLNTKVTVFMPVYNSEKYLKKSIDSILLQSYKDFEFLIINDGSTDKSVEIINSYNDPRIRLIDNKENKGLPYTRNLAIKESRGDFLMIMDSDDISYKFRLEKELEFLEKNEKVDIVATNADFVNEESFIENKMRYKSEEEINIELLIRCCIINPSVMLKKDKILKKNILYRTENFIAQDYAFWIDCVNEGLNINILPEALMAYRVGHENITKKSTLEKSIQRRSIINDIRSRALFNKGFYLDEEQMKYYNKIFSDPIEKIEDFELNEIKESLLKIVKINEEEKKLDSKLFASVFRRLLVDRLYIHDNISVFLRIKLLMTSFGDEALVDKIVSIIKLLKYKIYNKNKIMHNYK